MGHLQTLIDPNSTSQLLNDLGLAIDETKIVKAINSLSKQLNNIEASSGKSTRTQYLNSEIESLKLQLNSVRDQANLQMQY